MAYQKLRNVGIVNRRNIAEETKSPPPRPITANSERTLIVIRFKSSGKFLPF